MLTLTACTSSYQPYGNYNNSNGNRFRNSITSTRRGYRVSNNSGDIYGKDTRALGRVYPTEAVKAKSLNRGTATGGGYTYNTPSVGRTYSGNIKNSQTKKTITDKNITGAANRQISKNKVSRANTAIQNNNAGQKTRVTRDATQPLKRSINITSNSSDNRLSTNKPIYNNQTTSQTIKRPVRFNNASSNSNGRSGIVGRDNDAFDARVYGRDYNPINTKMDYVRGNNGARSVLDPIASRSGLASRSITSTPLATYK
jgi:hypothetical protein